MVLLGSGPMVQLLGHECNIECTILSTIRRDDIYTMPTGSELQGCRDAEEKNLEKKGGVVRRNSSAFR